MHKHYSYQTNALLMEIVPTCFELHVSYHWWASYKLEMVCHQHLFGFSCNNCGCGTYYQDTLGVQSATNYSAKNCGSKYTKVINKIAINILPARIMSSKIVGNCFESSTSVSSCVHVEAYTSSVVSVQSYSWSTSFVIAMHWTITHSMSLLQAWPLYNFRTSSKT